MNPHIGLRATHPGAARADEPEIVTVPHQYLVRSACAGRLVSAGRNDLPRQPPRSERKHVRKLNPRSRARALAAAGIRSIQNEIFVRDGARHGT
jgi:hypothetical protein